MVDFQKSKVRYVDPNVWLNHDSLDFKAEISERTGEISNKSVAEYFGLKFILYFNKHKRDLVDSMWIHGSLHKYSNFLKGISAPNQFNDELKSKGFNGNDFMYKDFNAALDNLESEFGIDFEHSSLHHLEIGLNCRHDLRTDKILDGFVLHYGAFFNAERSKYKYIQRAIKSQLVVKAYDKTLQYGLFYEVLRFEAKYKKMQRINELNIYSLHDIRHKANLDQLFEELIRQFDQVFFIDHLMNKETLSDKELSKLKDYSSQAYWASVLPQHRDRPKNRYRGLEHKCKGITKETIKTLLEANYESLMNCVRIDSSSNKSKITHLPILNTHYGQVG